MTSPTDGSPPSDSSPPSEARPSGNVNLQGNGSPPYVLEACVDSLEGALAAQSEGAHRLELCAELALGGTTPSAGLLALARERIELPLVVLVRPRSGDFLYTAAEFETLGRDITAAKDAGADGVALGVLTAHGELDVERMARLIELARPLSVTLHRAFDMTVSLGRALEQAVSLGVDRILTSGGRATVTDGLATLAELARQAGERVVILPGGGVCPAIVPDLLRETGTRELHASCRGTRPSDMLHVNPACRLSRPGTVEDGTRSFTDPALVRELLAALEAHAPS